MSKLAKIEPGKLNNSEFYTLSAAAYSALEDIQEDESQFNRFLHFAIEGYRSYNFDMAMSVEADEFEMKPWKQIPFPCDAVDIVKVGFRCGNIIKTFTLDRNTPKVFDKEGCDPVENKDCPSIFKALVSEDHIPFFGFYDPSGMLSPKYYGVALNYNHLGYFDIDFKRRVINFKETVKGQKKVYLEWISDGINYDGKTIIHPYAFKMIKLYIHWQRKENDDRYSLAEKRRAQELYNIEADEVLLRQMNLSLDDVKEALRSGWRQTVKN